MVSVFVRRIGTSSGMIAVVMMPALVPAVREVETYRRAAVVMMVRNGRKQYRRHAEGSDTLDCPVFRGHHHNRYKLTKFFRICTRFPDR